jgi:hypothetical protein
MNRDLIAENLNAVLAELGVRPATLRNGSVTINFDGQGVCADVEVKFKRRVPGAQSQPGRAPIAPS